MRNQQAKISSYILAILLSILFLFPIVWVILSSFKNGSELFRYPPTLLPSSPTIQNYIDTFAEGNFSLFFGNSAVVAVLSTILCVVINTMAGYAFAKYRFPGRNIIFFIFITNIINSFNVFESVTVMTSGGPLNSTTTLVHQIYTRSFTEYKLGYGSAIAMVLSIFVLLFTFLSFRFGSQSNDTGN